MLDPYKLSFLNAFLFSLLILFAFFYKFVLKKKINLFLVLLILLVLPTLSFFRSGVFESGDFNIHIYRSVAFFDSLKEGNLMPSWAPDHNAKYGLPLFIFNYTLPYYFVSLFHALGLSFIASLKIFFIASFILSGIFMYLLGKKLFKNEIAAFTSAVFYSFAPYHLIDTHFKGVIGEVLSYVFIPLFFYFVVENVKGNRRIVNILLASLSFAAIITSHVFVAFTISVLYILYLSFLCLTHQKFNFVEKFLPLAIGSLMTAYVWLTPFVLGQFTLLNSTPVDFIPLENPAFLFFSPWRWGLLFQGPEGEIVTLIGYTQLLVLISTLFLIISRKVNKTQLNPTFFWTISAVIFIILIFPISKPIWEMIPFIKAVGQHRLLITINFITAIVAGYFIMSNIRRKWLILIIIFLTISSTILNWGHRRMIPGNDLDLIANIPLSTYTVDPHFYANTRWVDPQNPWFSEIPKAQIEVHSGTGKIESFKRNSTNHIYKVDAKTPLLIEENTLYFPGWEAKEADNVIPIYPSDEGKIRANLPAGNYQLSFFYKDVLQLKALKILGAFVVFMSLIIIMINLFKLYWHKLK